MEQWHISQFVFVIHKNYRWSCHKSHKKKPKLSQTVTYHKFCGTKARVNISLSVLIIFTIVKTMSLRKPSFFILCTESIRKYICRVYHQLSQYIAKLRRITIDFFKSCLVTIETPRNHSLSQHQIVFAIVEKYIGNVTIIYFKSLWT